MPISYRRTFNSVASVFQSVIDAERERAPKLPPTRRLEILELCDDTEEEFKKLVEGVQKQGLKASDPRYCVPARLLDHWMVHFSDTCSQIEKR